MDGRGMGGWVDGWMESKPCSGQRLGTKARPTVKITGRSEGIAKRQGSFFSRDAEGGFRAVLGDPSEGTC